MKKNIILNTAIIALLTILLMSCTANTKPNVYHSLITIKTDSYSRLNSIAVYVSQSSENNYEFVGMITYYKNSDEYDTGKNSHNITFYLDEGVYDIKFNWYKYESIYPNPPYRVDKEYILKNQKIEKGINYKYNLDELIITNE